MPTFSRNLTLIILLALISLLVALIIFVLRKSHPSNLDLKLLFIKIPKKNEKDKQPQDYLKDINFTEQLFASLASINRPFVFEASVHHLGEDINFYLAVPEMSVDFTIRQVHGLFPNCQVDLVSDYNIFNRLGFSSIGYLKLIDSYLVPIRTYREAEVDTFAPILSTLSKLHETEEGGSIQIVVNPVGADSNKKSVFRAIEELKKGKKLKDVKNTSFFHTEDFKTLIFPEDNKEVKDKVIIDDEAIKTLQAKIAKPLFKINVRLVTSARSKQESDALLNSLSGSFSQFSSPMRNGFKLVTPRNARKLIFQYVFREYDSAQAMILNTEEIASIFHLPTPSTNVPRIAWLITEQAPPPSNLPEEGVIIGESVFRGESKLVRITDNDRRRHLYIIGQTGTGKSYMMGNMAVQDMEDGKGLCMIDPHGTTIDALLERVPPHRINDVIYFDPGDLRRPIGLNMLEYDLNKPEQKTFIVNEIQSIFNQLFDKETMGPMFEQYMRNALLLLMGDMGNEPATMTEVPRIFTDSEYRQAKLERCKDPMVIDFWTKEAIKTTGEAGLANMTPYITSKFGNFISNEYMRPIIGQTQSAFNFRKVMDEHKILLVNLAKGKIGDINSALLGMIFTGRLLMAALSRGDVDEDQRPDFYLYIDEFQNYTTESIATILSEARKYRLNLILAHQYIAQLKDNIRESVLGNVGSMVSFRIGSTDAETLIKQFGPEFTEKDLTTVENGHAFAKILINGEPSRPFSFRTIRSREGSTELKDNLKKLSSLTYGRDLQVVESEILARLRG